jgi:predicted dehydrogenase
VLDSCFGNALAHQVHDLLFWLGAPGLDDWARLSWVRAELYRAHAIESADTFFVEAEVQSGARLRIAITHAGTGPNCQLEVVECEAATLAYDVYGLREVRWRDGRIEPIEQEPFDPLLENYLDYMRVIRGDAARPATTLADSRPFVELNALAYVASGEITELPPGLVSEDAGPSGVRCAVRGLDAALAGFVTSGTWPEALGRARRSEPVTTSALASLKDVVRRLG